MSFTDTDLIARVVSGEDHHAFAELVRRYQSPVRAFLTRMTRGDGHLADDLAQETFLKAWKKMRVYRGEAKFSTWLLSIAFNEFRAVVRKRSESLSADLEESADEKQAEVVDHGLRMDLTGALERLSSSERAAILLCCQNGQSHEEAARILDCPVGTVKTNILRGKEKLKRLLSL